MPILLVVPAAAIAAEETWTPTATAGAPSLRGDYTAVWTGSKMIVWGGVAGVFPLDTGGIYDLATDTWTAMSTATALAGRGYHSAVWTGSKMIVWGG